jgi:hypothetical protein
MPEASRLAKILTKTKATPLGLIKCPDGTPTWDKVTSTKNIMLSLLPGIMTTPPTQQEYNQYLHSDTDVSWISVEAVTNTIKNLQPQKAAGQAQIT